ncbi:DUF3892 domain-containing protein [Acetonema longum]|uniref:DUF3892 domain-containing protein n=1 Tax=Acetonema longum DSM 6540 TaxID=1009370 RepID=F7NGR0_9FIRM|nr:DUF3892 domain-containing protein [Acetonema longum]EGO64864.1 hypothetical protein ALO_06240 [Acetonema longum DSM 6540]
MMKATKIKMKSGCHFSNNLVEIDEIYVADCINPGFYKKAAVYDCLVQNPRSIQVNIAPFPDLLPALSAYDEKYVRSQANDSPHDNLLKLPRE